MNNKFVLIGIPGSGKSTLGRLAALKLQIPFYNTDKLVYEKLNINQKKNPAGLFRNIDRFIEELSRVEAEYAKLKGSAIIEIHPESVLGLADIEDLKNMGTIIHIKRDLKVMLAEAKKKKNGMYLKYMNTGRIIDMQSETIRLYAKELPHFEKLADLTLNNDGTQNEGVKKLAEMIRNVMEGKNV